MTFHSSFLIRCWMTSTPDESKLKAYSIQHVQSGAEFRSADLSEVTQWMTSQNLLYLSKMASRPAEEQDRLEEEIG